MRRVEQAGRVVALLVMVLMLAGCERDGGNEGRRKTTGSSADPVSDSALPRTSGVALPQGVTTAMVDEGRRLFSTNCVVCHGPDAGGTQLGPSLRDAEWLDISGEYGEIERVIHTGVPEPGEYPVPMPPNGGGRFTAAEVRAMAAYVYSLSRGR
ncbi:MAG TPA: cytochrome c [Longimicrobiaceae bacterium]|nr:cytochrome c [Longimicrobiaceae bacterium]